jgi:hypothetical protein
MKTALKISILIVAVVGSAVCARGQSTAFTYHGQLNQNKQPVTGAYDMQFSVFDADTGNGLVAGPLPKNAVGVTNGLFTARIDFLGGVFTGPARWLEVSVRPAGNGNFQTLTPRQELTSSPYSIRAQTAGDVANGAVVKSLNNLRDNINLVAGANVTIAPSGNTLTISSTGPGGNIWSLNGADTYYNAGDVGIGSPEPRHRLRISGGAAWTGHGWGGAIELDNASAIAWNGNAPGNHFGIGQTTAGLYFFTTDDAPGTATIPPNYRMIIDNSGNVGIGVPWGQFPSRKLTVYEPVSHYGIEHTDGNVRLGTYLSSDAGWLGTVSNHKLHFYVNDGSPSLSIDTAGNVGIGATTPAFKLDVAGDLRGTRLILRADPFAPANAAVLCADPNVVNFVPFNYGTGRPLNIIARDAFVRQITITGGADLAEPFAMSEEGISPGSVVIIDEENPGHLKLSTEAYDTRVAGVVSGANGIKPGISLRQEGVIEDGENVALTGRVYVQADASFGAIKPGDLLTTSNTAGHAMKVIDHAKAQGAILGKAMSSLKQGKGTVLVLVTLQ